MHVNRTRLERIFFLIYFCAIILLLVWNLAHSGEMTWESRDVYLKTEREHVTGDPIGESRGDGQDNHEGTNEEEIQDEEEETAIELKDGHSLVLYSDTEAAALIGKKAKLSGLAILNYDNEKELSFREETIQAEVFSAGSGDLLGTAVMPLRNQSPYYEDEMQVYLAFSEAVEDTAEIPLEFHILTNGLQRNGVFFSPVKSEEEAPQGLIARAYYEKKTYHVFGSLVFFLLEALLGLVCMVLNRKQNVPLLFRRTNSSMYTRPVMTAKKLYVPAIITILCLLLFSYTYHSAIKKTSEAKSADYLMSGAVEKDRVKLTDGDVVRQTVIPQQDYLTGVGILIWKSQTDDKGEEVFSSAEAGTVLSWRVLDEEDGILGSGSAKIGELESVNSLLDENSAEKEMRKTARSYLFLPLEEPLSDTIGRRLSLEITAHGTEEIRIQASTGGNGTLMVNGSDKDLELCLLGIYDNNGFLKRFFFLLCVFLLLFLAGAWILAHRLRGNTAAMYLTCALLIGLVFSFMTPAYTVPDERSHIDTVYALSNRLLGINNPGGPSRILKRSCDVDMSNKNTMPISIERYRWETYLFDSASDSIASASSAEDHSRKENSSKTDTQSQSAATGTGLTTVFAQNALPNATVFCYLPAVTGFTAARLLGRNMVTMVMTARWMNLLVCVLMITLAIRKMPFGGAAMAVIAMFPRSLQLMSSCSYDGMMIAGTFIFTAWCFSFLCEEQYSIVDVMILSFSSIHVALCKGGAYLPLLGAILLIPFMKRGLTKNSRIRWLKAGALLLASGTFVFFIRHLGTVFEMFSRKAVTATLFAGTKTLFSVSDILEDPAGFLYMVMNTIQVRNDSMVGEMVGHILMKQNRLVYGFLFLAFLGILKKKGEQQIHFTIPGRIWVLLLAAVSTALISLSMLLAYTSADAYYIEGMQGRYFLPMLPLLYMAAENRLLFRDGLEDTAILYAADLLLVMTVCQILIVTFAGL